MSRDYRAHALFDHSSKYTHINDYYLFIGFLGGHVRISAPSIKVTQVKRSIVKS